MAKKISLYAVFTALCLAFSYIEMLIPFDFIAPGIKLGLGNAVALLLILKGDIRGAFCVNITRILLSALLFGGVHTLMYSLPAGLISVSVMAVMSKIKHISGIGFSICGAAVHNITQLTVALGVLGRGVLYYAPALLLSAAISGYLVGLISVLIFKKIKFEK